MNATEFKTEFNLAYNNLASNQAPGLDEVEISIYLTKAQNILVDALYGEFEKSEEARRKLADIIVTTRCSITSVAVADILYPEYTKTYSLPNNVRYIINEQVKMSSNASTCIKSKFLKVQPILHDEIDTIIDNPFKFNIRRALRLDTASNNVPYVEILTKDKEHIEYYQIRYVKTPSPIFIYNNTQYSDTIDGQEAPITLVDYEPASLPSTTHRQIVEIAAKLAYADYKN